MFRFPLVLFFLMEIKISEKLGGGSNYLKFLISYLYLLLFIIAIS